MSGRTDGADGADTTRTDGPSTAAMAETLTRVRSRYGPAALLDPVALRSALRTLDGVDPAVGEALTTVVDSGAADRLRAADQADTVDAERALDAATGTVHAATGLAEADARRACEAFLAAFAAHEGPAVRWDADEQPVERATGRPARPRRLLVGIAALLVTTATVAAAVLLARPTADPAAPDRYAVDQVAQRYRALGSTLLAGAERCGPTAPQPGQTERVECAFDGTWSMVLTSYDTAGRLTETRRGAVRPAAGSLRNARSVDADADVAFAVDETAGGASTVYWDATVPRPVSATLSTTQLPLPDLVDRFDTRGAPLQRPEVPGAAFRSGTLFALAEAQIAGTDAQCAPGAADGWPGALEVVSCTLPNGASFTFTRLARYEDVLGYRVRYAGEAGKVPGTLRNVGGWTSSGDEARGQFAEFVAAEDGNAHLYFDDEATFCVGLMTHPDLGQDELRALWTG